MANAQEKLALFNETSPLTEDDYLKDDDQYYDKAAGKTCGCACFEELCFTRWQRSNNNGVTVRYVRHQQEDHQEIRESWVKKRVKKVKEITEVLARPKWKTFIRSFSNLHGTNKKRRAHMQFQYDPQSYKLNFDDGTEREVDYSHLDFPVRYAAPVVEINNGESVRT